MIMNEYETPNSRYNVPYTSTQATAIHTYTPLTGAESGDRSVARVSHSVVSVTVERSCVGMCVCQVSEVCHTSHERINHDAISREYTVC